MVDLGTIFSKNVFLIKKNMGTCFYKDTEQNGPLLLKGEPTVPSSESRAEQSVP